MDEDGQRVPSRFGVRKLLGCAVIAVIGCALFVPYPTQVFPALDLQFVDEHGKELPDTYLEWRGGFYAYYMEKRVLTDKSGRIELPAQTVSLSLAARTVALTTDAFGICGGLSFNVRRPSAAVDVPIPFTYELDPSCIAVPPDFDSGYSGDRERIRDWTTGGGWNISLDEGADAGRTERLHVATSRPEETGVTKFRFVFRSRTPRMLFGRIEAEPANRRDSD